MSLGVSKVSFSGVSNVNNTTQTDGVKNIRNSYHANQGLQADTVDFQSGKLSDTEKKELILKARTKAAGWSCFGEVFSTLYYGLRSDNTVAKKFNLDPDNDKALIKRIKREQILWTVPSIIPGLGFIGGLAAYIYNKNCDADDIDL